MLAPNQLFHNEYLWIEVLTPFRRLYRNFFITLTTKSNMETFNSSNSEADSSELIEPNLKEIFPRYYMDSEVISRLV